MSRHKSDSSPRPTSFRHSRVLSVDVETEEEDGGDILERAIQRILDDDGGRTMEHSFFQDVEGPLGKWILVELKGPLSYKIHNDFC